jgi:hypothetical protein
MIFEQWCLLQRLIVFHFSITLKQCLHFTGLQACHSWICHVIFAAVEDSLVGAPDGRQTEGWHSISTMLFAASSI